MSMITTKLTPGNTTTEQPSERITTTIQPSGRRSGRFGGGELSNYFLMLWYFPSLPPCRFQETNSKLLHKHPIHVDEYMHVHFISCMSCSLLQPVTEPDAPSFSQKPCDCGRSAPQLCMCICMHMFACSSKIIHTRYITQWTCKCNNIHEKLQKDIQTILNIS